MGRDSIAARGAYAARFHRPNRWPNLKDSVRFCWKDTP
jgi:hypothetical protein